MEKTSKSKQTCSKKGLSQFLVEEKGQPRRLLISMEGLPKFLVDANAAVETGRIAEAADILNDQAIETVRQMLERNPSRIDVMLLVAIMLGKTGQFREAEQWYKKLLEAEPHALVLNELACIYHSTGRLSMAMEYRAKALAVAPDNPGILGNFAVDLMLAGRMQDGVDLLQKVVEEDSDNVIAHSNLLWYMHYLPSIDPQVLFDEHRRWGQIHAPPSRARVSHDNDPDPDRRLRVAYISPDFYVHSVAYNFEAFLSGRDHQATEVYGYGNVAKPDEMTERLKQQFDHYRNIRGLDDKTVADMIERDKIDILVEIGGHSCDNRLLVLAYKPAPVQVDYGGINTSGMEQIDYRFTDGLLDSPETEKFYVEELIYLPCGFICYRPPDFAPPVTPLPAVQKGYVTFGSFNACLKINPYIMSLWAQVLKATEGSHFLLKFGGAGDSRMKDYYYREFERLGIGPERMEIHGWKRTGEHLKLYGQTDIVLDTYPFNGCVTTLEGLWMGVPMISLAGREHSFLSRAGLSILSRLDMDFFATSTPDEYVAKATALAANLNALAKIRGSMRQRMAASTLCDAKAYTRSIETAYRTMWCRWCRSRGVNVPEDDLTPKERGGGVEVSVSSGEAQTAPGLSEGQ
jgi:predicted O-linked N-acetylglucosamine transferase (SPINDLY family)